MYSRWFAILGALVITPVLAQHQHHSFLERAVAADLAEIELGKLAMQRGESEEVRAYGQRLVADHERALAAAREAARELGASTPQAPTAQAQEVHRLLSELSGAEFDRAFLAHLVTDHEKHVAEYRVQADERESAATAHARRMLGTLDEHLAIAERLNTPAPRLNTPSPGR
jgi:putative membrane protein